MSFLFGAGEMASRIREHNWIGHPFGPPTGWPQSLRSALSICLHSAFPTAIYWGSELRLLYNDAWAPIPGPRHPAALGAPAQEVWSDIWHVIEPQFSYLIETGEGIFVEDQLLPMRRLGTVEETYWSYSFTPIRGENGAIAGVFNSGHETTGNVLARRQMRFLLQLNDEFRSTADPTDARRTAIRLLGEHLKADRVGIREVEFDSSELTVVDEWTAEGVPSVGDGVPIRFLGEWAHSQLMAGHALRFDDVTKEPKLAEARHVFGDLGVAAAIAVPWMHQRRPVAIIFVHSREPRTWTDFDVKTAEEVLERTLGWMDREKAAERERTMMREIDHRARNALAVVQSVVNLTNAEDVQSLREQIADRIAALGRTHDLLSSERWQAVELGALVREELAPYTDPVDGRVSASGPRMLLHPEQAQTVALLLHELATNAAKHGALSQEGGTLEVQWFAPSNGALELEWREHLDESQQPLGEPQRTGFGTTLLRRIVVDQLGGTVSRTFARNGLQCRLVIPFVSGSATHVAASPTVRSQQDDRKSVLIVEDEAILAMDIARLVEEMGFKVFATASTVEAALACLESQKPDFAMLDANLGGSPSTPVAERLVALEVPVIVATGYVRQPSEGLDSLARFPRLSKPVNDDALAKTISELGFPVKWR